MGNDLAGIRVLSSDVVNTRIGTNADGTSDALERNVIAGPTGADGNLFDVGTNTLIAGNDIGTDEHGRLYLIDRAGAGMHILEYTG